MKKITKAILVTIFMFMCLFTTVYATSNEKSQETLKGESTGKLLEIKKHELTTIEDYKEKYGSDAYGIAAYVLNIIRIYSIPFCFLGIAISAIYQYVIGIRKLDTQEKGLVTMISFITILVICQILPLAFAIVVKFGRG